jgi:hypothetical protein
MELFPVVVAEFLNYKRVKYPRWNLIRGIGVSDENQVNEVKVKLIPWFIVAFMLVLSACVAPTSSPTQVPTKIPSTPTIVSSSTLTGRIVYSNENDIYVMDLAGLRVTRLTNDPEWISTRPGRLMDRGSSSAAIGTEMKKSM